MVITVIYNLFDSKAPIVQHNSHMWYISAEIMTKMFVVRLLSLRKGTIHFIKLINYNSFCDSRCSRTVYFFLNIILFVHTIFIVFFIFNETIFKQLLY